MRLIAHGLGFAWSDVETMWSRAVLARRKQDIESHRKTTVNLSSWIDRPNLTAEVQDILEAQLAATESLPYALLGVQRPKLAEVYVRQSVRQSSLDRIAGAESEVRPQPHVDAKGVNQTGQEPEPLEQPMSVSDALNASQHLVIIGEPGAGKSTLGYAYIERISHYWLSGDVGSPIIAEPVLPIRISARALSALDAWDSLVSNGLKEALGRLLSWAISAEMFSRRQLGARWLLFIDGLDEIADRETRASVVRAIARQSRRNADYRLVLTTRPLPKSQLNELISAGMTPYVIQPFGAQEIENFAAGWFRAQDFMSAPEQSSSFTNQISEGRLAELVKNPLLLTIAAIVFTREPSRPLPSNRLSLYAEFVGTLLDETVAGRNIHAAFESGLGNRSGGSELLRWLAEQQLSLLSHLAVATVTREAILIDAAREYLSNNAPTRLLNAGLPVDDLLIEFLVGTGILVRADISIRFLHHSFAEYIAAIALSDEIGDELQKLEEWIDRAADASKHQFAVFALVNWIGQDAQRAGKLLLRLLDSEADRAILAGEILLEGAPAASEILDRVATRLTNLILAGNFNAAKSLGLWCASTSEVDRMRALVSSNAIDVSKRIQLAIGLGRIAEPREGVEALDNLLSIADIDDIPTCAQGIAELVSNGPQRAERAIAARAAGSPAATKAFCVEAFIEIGRAESARNVLREMVAEAQSASRDETTTPCTTMTLAQPGADHSSLGLELKWWNDPDSCSEVAEWASKIGLVDEARWCLNQCLTNDCATEDDFSKALSALCSLGGEQLETFEQILSSRPNWWASPSLTKLYEAGMQELAWIVAEKIMREKILSPDCVAGVARLWASSGDESSSSSFSNLWTDPRFSRPAYLEKIAAALVESRKDLGAELAKRVLMDKRSDRWELSSAVQTLLRADRDTLVVIMQDIMPIDYSSETLYGLAEGLVDSEEYELALQLIVRDVADPTSYGWWRPLRGLCRAGYASRVRPIVEEVSRFSQSDYYETDLIDLLIEAGLIDDANLRIHRILHGNPGVYRLERIVELWLKANGSSAVHEFIGMICHHATSQTLIGVAKALAANGLLSEASDMWMLGVRHPLSRPSDIMECVVALASHGLELPDVGDSNDLKSDRFVLLDLVGEWLAGFSRGESV